MYKKISSNDKIIEATCDICGADCMKPIGDDDDNHEASAEFEGMILEAVWGYMSDGLDGEIWEACACQKCVEEKLSPFISFHKTLYQ
jgi:hypothetical protein